MSDNVTCNITCNITGILYFTLYFDLVYMGLSYPRIPFFNLKEFPSYDVARGLIGNLEFEGP